MEILPKELKHIIISYVSLNDEELLKFLITYPEFKSDDYLFQQLFQWNFPGLYSTRVNTSWYTYYMKLMLSLPHVREIELLKMLKGLKGYSMYSECINRNLVDYLSKDLSSLDAFLSDNEIMIYLKKFLIEYTMIELIYDSNNDRFKYLYEKYQVREGLQLYLELARARRNKEIVKWILERK